MEEQELLHLQAESRNLGTAEFIAWSAEHWQLLHASSISAEDQVLWDMLWQNYRQAEPGQAGSREPHLFTLDTGRLPQETYACIEEIERHYGIRVELVFPLAEDLQRLHRQGGPNLFYQGEMQRKLCCKFRKVEPLGRRLQGHLEQYRDAAAWLTGQRRSQSVTRGELQRLEWDEQFHLAKLNPLADWSREQIWDYIREHQLPYHALYDQNYLSIGCVPCTRAVSRGEDERAGRWWWESPEQKECGIHISEDGIIRRTSQK